LPDGSDFVCLVRETGLESAQSTFTDFHQDAQTLMHSHL